MVCSASPNTSIKCSNFSDSSSEYSLLPLPNQSCLIPLCSDVGLCLETRVSHSDLKAGGILNGSSSLASSWGRFSENCSRDPPAVIKAFKGHLLRDRRLETAQVFIKRRLETAQGERRLETAQGERRLEMSLVDLGNSVRFENAAKPPPAPPAPWNQVSVAQHTQTPLRAASQREPPELSPCVPPRCPTPGTPTVPLVPLVRSLRAWLAFLSLSRWLIRTIRLGYAIQFGRYPPKFRAIHSTTVRAADAHVLRAEITVLLAKDVIEPVPPADMRSGHYSPYFIVPQKGCTQDLRLLNWSLHKLPFKMLTQRRIFECIRPRDWLQ
ncbi:hypothetical protein PO909_014708 [Leuciscus waleckii]